MQDVRVRVLGIHGQRGAKQRVAAGLAVGLEPARRAEQRARIVRVCLQNFLERLLRFVKIVFPEEQLAEPDLRRVVRRIDGRSRGRRP